MRNEIHFGLSISPAKQNRLYSTITDDEDKYRREIQENVSQQGDEIKFDSISRLDDFVSICSIEKTRTYQSDPNTDFNIRLTIN